MSNIFSQVFSLVSQIPFGRVTTYGQIARLLGNPRLSHIVGYALHTAPEGLPCHRVVNHRGCLCEAFQPLGHESHRLLLELENIPFLPSGRVDLYAVMWYGPEDTV